MKKKVASSSSSYKMGKRGQQTFSMSFGMIFSIFLIIMIVAIAIYAIVKFVDIGGCAQVGLFYEDLQGEMDRAWNSGSGRYEDGSFEIRVHNSVKNVCFGNASSASSPYTDLADKFIDYEEGRNVFLDPPEEICNELGSKKINHVIIPSFFCEEVDNKGNIKIKISKPSGGALVEIRKSTSQ